MKLIPFFLLFILTSCAWFQPSRYKILGCYKSQVSMRVMDEGEEIFSCEKYEKNEKIRR